MTWDAADYQKRVLLPALEVFAKEGRLPDLFTRYDLPLYAAESEQVEARLGQVVSCWNKLKPNKKYSYLLAALLDPQELERARATLLDPERRATERAAVAADRQARQDRVLAELDQDLQVVAGKGYYTPEELEKLKQHYLPRGVPEAEILARLRVPLREARAGLPVDEGLPAPVRSQIKSNLSVLGHANLYEFLGLEGPVPPDELAACTGRVSDYWLEQAPDFRRAAAQELLGLTKRHLLEGDPTRYEAAMRWEIVEQLRPKLELAAADRRITHSEFAALMDFAVRAGLAESLARDIVLALAEEHSAHVEWSSVDSIRCGYCSTSLPRDGPPRCTTCGHRLWFACPRCQGSMASSEAACGHCGFVLAHLVRYRELSRSSVLHAHQGDLKTAWEEAREASRLWGEGGTLTKALEERTRQLEALRGRVEENLARKALVASGEALRELAREAPGYVSQEGHTLANLTAEVEGPLHRHDELVRQAAACEDNGQIEEAAAAYQEALALAGDSPAALPGLLRLPPQPPAALRVTTGPEPDTVRLEWSPSPSAGRIEYEVFRSGQFLETTSTSSCTDPQAPPGATLLYSVVAVRSGARSSELVSRPVLLAHEAEDLDVRVGDALVELFWKPPVGEGRVRVFRQPGAEVEAGERGLRDDDVENGIEYAYRVLVEFPGGIRSNGVQVCVTPEAAPPVVETLQARAAGERVEFSSHPGTTIHRCAVPPAHPEGACLSRRELAELGPDLPCDEHPCLGEAWYVPVSHAGNVAVLGRAVRAVWVPDVSELTARDLGHYLQLT
ncbi:MAG: hypothetical protein AB1758_12310, partial [Candidatus Eremiobacterota bacterium]